MNDKSHAATPAAAPINKDVPEPSVGIASNMSPKYEWNEDGWGEPHGAVAQAHGETVADRLKRVYPEHYTRIITEMNRQNGSEHAARQLSSPCAGWTTSGCVLQGAFLWGNSQEGFSFWAKLAEREHSNE